MSLLDARKVFGATVSQLQFEQKIQLCFGLKTAKVCIDFTAS